MDERLRFVARLLEGEKTAVLCREFENFAHAVRRTGFKRVRADPPEGDFASMSVRH